MGAVIFFVGFLVVLGVCGVVVEIPVVKNKLDNWYDKHIGG